MNKRFFFKGTNLLCISGLSYKIKDNARMLHQVTISCAVAFTAIATLYSVDSQLLNMIKSDQPLAINYLSLPGNKFEANHVDAIKQSLDESKLDYEFVKTPFMHIGNTNVMNQDEYNRLANLANIEPLQVDDETAYHLINAVKVVMTTPLDSITVGNKKFSKVKIARPFLPSWTLDINVVSNKNYDLLRSTNKYTLGHLYTYETDWAKTGPISDHLFKNVIIHSKNDNNSFHTIIFNYKSMKEMTSTTLYIGTFIGIIFFITAGSFLYFRLFNDINTEKQKYIAISKLGLTKKEFKRIATTEIALLFFIPYIFATIHTIFAMIPLQSLLANVSIITPSSSVLIIFLILQIIYFLLIRYRYINYLSKYVKF